MLDILSVSLLSITVMVCGYIFFAFGKGTSLMRFPFLITAVYVAYIVPKLANIWTSNSYLADAYRQSGTVDALIISASLCYFGALLGYRLVRPGGHFEERRWTFSASQYDLVLRIAVLLLAISLTGIIGLAQSAGGMVEFFFEMNSYSLDWRGSEVHYIFLARFIYIPIFLLFILYIHKKSKIVLFFIALSLIYPIANILLLFRRSEIITVGTVLAFVFIAYYRYRPRRTTVTVAVLAMLAAVVLFPEIRSARLQDGQLPQESTIETFDEYSQFRDNSEIAMAAYRVQRTRDTQNYGYGVIFWNGLVSQFVPASVVGQNAKQQLYWNFDQQSYDFYGWNRSSYFYLAPIGFSQAFEELGYFCFAIFSALGALMGLLERLRRSSLTGELMYVLMLAPAALGISNDIQIPLVKFVAYSIVIGLLWATGQWSRLQGIRREGDEGRPQAGVSHGPRFSGALR